MKPVAVYLRVSTDEQNTEGQKRELQDWLTRHAIAAETVEWLEDIYSAKTVSRAAFSRLLAGVKSGDIKTVICWKLDRISRTMFDGMQLIADWTARGVRVVSTTQQIDVSGVMGQVMAAMLFGFAQMELEYRAQRQELGIQTAKSRGRYKGRERGTFKADPDRARQLRGRGLQLKEIARSLGCSTKSVQRYLGDPSLVIRDRTRG